MSVGPEGFEPSPLRLRAGDAAGNTSVPCFISFVDIQLARKELNPRPASYKDAALTAELRASSWAGGIRTHTHLIKSQGCDRYTTTQDWLWRIRLHRTTVDIRMLLKVRF
jgi:hypothetical protein